MNGPETIHAMVPLSIKGMRWDEKKRVLNERGERLGELISGTYEQKELYGSLRSFGGEKTRTFSHKDTILPSNASVAREIRDPNGVSGLDICGEWEKKIMKTQGHINVQKSFAEAFTLHEQSSPYFGTYFKWEVDAIEKRASAGFGKSLFRETVRTPVKSQNQGGGGHLYTSGGDEVKVPKLW